MKMLTKTETETETETETLFSFFFFLSFSFPLFAFFLSLSFVGGEGGYKCQNDVLVGCYDYNETDASEQRT